MDTTLLENQSLELKAAAKDFQRLIDQQIALFRNEKEEHKKTVEKLNNNIQEIKDKLFKLETQQKNKQDDLRISMEEIDKLQNEIDNLKLEENQLIEKKKEVEAHFIEKRQKISEQTQSLNMEKEKENDNKMLTNGLLFYSQRLQMFLNKDAEGIRITFRCIDKHHPKRRYYVVLRVNDEEKWELIRTKPELANANDMIQSLNLTNDINTFLRQVRNAFKNTFCESDCVVCNNKQTILFGHTRREII